MTQPPTSDRGTAAGAWEGGLREQLSKVFEGLDNNGSGYVEANEVEMAMERLNIPVTKAAIRTFLRSIDKDGDNKISFGEFASFVLLREEALQRIYRGFLVARQDGKDINVAEFRRALRSMNVLLSTKETKRLVDIISGDTQHVITFQDFCSLLLLLPPESATEMFHDWISENAWDVGEGLTLPDDTGDVEGWMLLAQVPAPKQAKRRDGAASHGAAQSHTKRSHPPKASATAGDTVAEAVKQQVRRPRSGAIPVNGVLDGFRTIYKEGGWPGFWRGNGANVIKVAPETAVKFYVYESMRKWICADEHAVTIPERFISGAVAGAVGQVAIYPLEIAKTRMALARKGEYRGILDCLLKILRFEGPSCMYRGMGASLMGIVPYAGTDLTIYSLLRDAYGAKYPDEPPGAATLLGCGAIASTCGQVVAYPLQLVRTRLQAQGMHKRPVVYQGILDCVRKTVAEGGIRGLYRGMLPNFLKALPAISISYVVYEKTKRGLRDIDPKRLPWE